MRTLSLGAGVQSSTLFLLSCRGELPRLDHAIFADTKWEPALVYEHLEWLEAQGRAAGIPILRVGRGDLRADMLKSVIGGRARGGKRWVSMPLFTRAATAAREGMIRRQCTREYKLDPIRRKLRELVGALPGRPVPDGTAIEQWMGISSDEVRRCRVSRDWWVTFRYPLVFDRPMRRDHCQHWLTTHYPTRTVPRSACIGCPFHSNAEWRGIRERPDEWADAVAFDAAIREQEGLDGKAYLHRSCLPLDQAPIDDVDPNQGSLWSQECLGMCGV